MLTKKKIEIYSKYSGDIDLWARVGSRNEIKLMNDNEWRLIDDLVQSLKLINSNLTSENFKIKIFEKLYEICEDENTQNELRALVGKSRLR